jgi:hypothetical protein
MNKPMNRGKVIIASSRCLRSGSEWVRVQSSKTAEVPVCSCWPVDAPFVRKLSLWCGDFPDFWQIQVSLIHASVNFASFCFRGLWSKDNILCRIVWK